MSCGVLSLACILAVVAYYSVEVEGLTCYDCDKPGDACLTDTSSTCNRNYSYYKARSCNRITRRDANGVILNVEQLCSRNYSWARDGEQKCETRDYTNDPKRGYVEEYCACTTNLCN